MHQRRRRHIQIISIIALSLMAIFLLGSWIAARSFVAAHHQTIGSVPTVPSIERLDVAFTTLDGLKLRGWYYPAEGRRGAVLLHGYMANRLEMVDRAMMFRRAGFSVLIYDARASGESDGDVISFGYNERNDLLAALDFMRSRGVDDITCLGASQGGATIAFAGDKLKGVRCIILESTYNTLETTIERRFNSFLGCPLHPFGDLLLYFGEKRLGVSMDSIKPVRAITSLRVPLMIISGKLDGNVSVDDTYQLFNAATVKKELWLVPNAGHYDLILRAGPEYEKRVMGFVERMGVVA